ncbi:ABC-type branched-subunit amino acid transport system ATPase component [Bradyrhizobium sp. LM3.6]
MTETLAASRPSPSIVPAPPLLGVRNIEVVYDDVILVLRGLSLDVPKGAIVALLGANGAGKSTTLKAISGLLKTEDGEVTRGEILFEGERINGIDPDKIVRRGIFQVMEGRRIVADMTSLENLKLGAFTRKDREVGADLDMVFDYFPRLKERTGLAGYLSGGEQQMLAIGRALMARPKMILMDEPSMGLSPLLVKEVFSIIQKINRDLGVTILLVEQNATRRPIGGKPRLHHGAGQGRARRHRGRIARQRGRQGILPRRRRRPAQELQEPQELQAAQALALTFQYLLRFRDCAENMIERRRRNGVDQRFAVAIELVVPAAPHGMVEIMPFEPRQRQARLVRRARLAGFGLRDPRLRNLGLRPQPARAAANVAGVVALVDQAAVGRVGDSAARSPAVRRAAVQSGSP